MAKQDKFVLSANEFDTIEEAENRVNGWWTGDGKELKKKTKLYKITKVYELKLKFVERKKRS